MRTASPASGRSDTRSRFWRFAFIGFAVFAVWFLFVPKIRAVNDDIKARTILIDGKPHLLITGSYQESISALWVVRVYTVEDRTFVIDIVTSPLTLSYFAFMGYPIVREYPFEPGHWKVKALMSGGLQTIYEFDVPETSRR